MNEMQRLVQQQLRALGLRLPPDVVSEVVRHLDRGASLYSIYEGTHGTRFVAKGTATKIRDLWREGKLRFLNEMQPEKRDIDTAVEDARTAGPYGPSPLGWKATADHYFAIMQEMPSVEWSIRGLESAGLRLDGHYGGVMTTTEKRVYSITEFAKLVGLGRSLAYLLAKENRLPVPVIRLGSRYMISKRAVDALLNGETADGKPA